MKRAALIGLVLALVSSLLLARVDFPKATGLVNDFANVLDASAREQLDQLLKQTERETTAEIVFVSVTSLDGMSEDEYANKLFKDWGIGKKKEDNGVLVLVAPTERAMKIEVGYGLEGVLPDGLAGEIIRAQFLPQFRKNDYPAGIRDGMRRITEVVRADHVLTAEERQRLDQASSRQGPAWVLVPFMGIFVAIGAFAIGLGVRAKTVGPILFGLGFHIPFLIALAMFFTITLYTLGPLSLAMMVLGYRKGAMAKWRNTAGSKGTGWTMGGGSSSGGSSSGSSWSSGGGSSSSGSSFGGGSSGGGGASGRW